MKPVCTIILSTGSWHAGLCEFGSHENQYRTEIGHGAFFVPRLPNAHRRPQCALAKVKLVCRKSREDEMKSGSTRFKSYEQLLRLIGRKSMNLPSTTVFKSSRSSASVVFTVFLSLLAPGTSGLAQQTTGQLLISSGFNPIAATTTELMARLSSYPANHFLLRNKGGHPYYFYADPSGCGCAYVGSVSAMKKYSVTVGTLQADAIPSGGGPTKLEQTMIDSMDNDDAGAQFNEDVFGPDP
jgi:hypothetical protein